MAGSQLKKRGTVYYARQVVPVDLQRLMGKRELARSLNTHDRRTAKLRCLDVRAEWERQFAALRRRREMTEADFATATWQHYVGELDHDGAERAAASGTSPTPKWREFQLRALRAHLGRGETVAVEWAADAYIEQHQLLVERDSGQYRELCFRLMRAQIEAIERAGERDAGDYSGKPADPIVTRPAATAEVAKPGETIKDLFDRYAKENPKRITEAALTQARRDIGTFIELAGSDFPVSKIDKKAVREWKALLQRYPVKAAEMTVFKDKSFREVIETNDKATEPKRVIVAKTVNRYMAGFGAFCNWLAAHDYIAANPFTDMYLSVDKTKTSTKTFTPEQLKALFASPLFTGCQDHNKWHVPGDHHIRDHRYWLPFVMMYSGARPGEIAQLLIDDVREMHGVWVMHITDEGDETIASW